MHDERQCPIYASQRVRFFEIFTGNVRICQPQVVNAMQRPKGSACLFYSGYRS